MSNLIEKPPSWFTRIKYPQVRLESSANWYEALNIRTDLENYYKNTFVNANEKSPIFFTKEGLWETYLKSISNNNTEGKPVFTDGIGIRDIPLNGNDAMDIIQTHAKYAPYYQLLLIDPNCPDKLLVEQFKQWLINIRKEHPLAIKRAGKPSTNLEFTKNHFQSWQEYKVVALFDLLFYETIFDKKFTNNQLGNWLYPEQSQIDTTEKVKEAKKILKAALKSINSLAYQAGDELSL